MPTYTYLCEKCQKNFDIKASLEEKEKNDPNQFKCPQCGAKEISRKLSNVVYVKNAPGGHDHSACASGTCPFA